MRDPTDKIAIAQQIETLRARRGSMKLYLNMKNDAEDMHAVQDAASDIRELDAKIEALTAVLGA